MDNYNLVHIAQTLETTMMSAGYIDDLDEIVADMIDNKSEDELYDWAIGVDESISFINDILDKNYTIDAIAEVNEQLGR